MPVVTGKTVGKQNVAKAGSNSEWTSASKAAGAAAFGNTPLDCPGLPKLTWIVIQTGGAGGLFQPQVAIRRGDFNVTAQLSFVGIGPPALLVPGIASVFEFNAPVQAIRAAITPPLAGVNQTYLVYMFASG